VEILRFPSTGIGSSYRAPHGLLSFLIRSRRCFDLVHAHNYHAPMLPIAALSRPYCLIVTAHLNDHAHSSGARLLHLPYARLGGWSLARADRVVCVSEAERQRIAGRFRLPSDRLCVIPNGVDVERLQSACPGEPREQDLLLVVSRLEAYKRVDLAIETLAALPQPYHLVIVGQGSRRRRLAELARQRGVAGRTTFLGSLREADLVRWYRRAAVLLNLSTAEAFGLTVLESIGAGCRAMCSDIPAFRDLAVRFPNHVTLAPLHSPHALASAVRSYAESPAVPLPDLSSFRWEAVVDRLLAVYQDVLLNSPVRPCSSSAGPIREREGVRP
jgi:glycosyltransferase involved in cell wall biosynthesis